MNRSQVVNDVCVSTPTAVETQIQKSISAKRRVGILGGTFDPIHYGHLMVAEQVFDQLHLDEVIFFPNAIPPHKEKSNATTDAQRVEMLELALADNPHFSIDTLELERSGKSYTYDTMDILTTLHPDTSFHFIIGADMVMDLPNWHRIDELLELVTFVGVKREGYLLETEYPIVTVDIVDSEVSSSIIRRNVFTEQSIRYFVPESVRAYINEKGLYLDSHI